MVANIQIRLAVPSWAFQAIDQLIVSQAHCQTPFRGGTHFEKTQFYSYLSYLKVCRQVSLNISATVQMVFMQGFVL